MDDIAYTNALPWRTANESGFAKKVAKKTAEFHLTPLLLELEPKIIIAVGKKAAEILDYAKRLGEDVVVWNRARALNPDVIAEREAAATKLAKLLNVVF